MTVERRRRGKTRPQAGVGRLKPAPPLRANSLVAQAVSPAICWFLLALLLPFSASAQSVRGTVTDDGRKALEGVAVHLFHQETNRPRHALTDSRGEFTISNLRSEEHTSERQS